MVVALIFTLIVAATPIVSPALNIIAKNNTMIKSGLIYSDVYFSENDFKKSLGINSIETIKVEELPAAEEGVLKLGTLNVTKGQSINKDYLSVLRFVPTDDTVFNAKMIFSCEGIEIPCVVKLIDEINYAPTFLSENDSVNTYSNVSCYGNIRTSDPEGDITDIQIVMYPEHGTLNVTDSTRGSFKYTPTNGFVGEDEFVVVARDNYGNYSSTQTINVCVENNGIFFKDTVGHWCENAAINLYQAGAVEVANYNEGMVFCPDDSITREEFVTIAMKALGAVTLTDTNSSFSDNSTIDVRYRPYVATAQRMGYINGKNIIFFF